MNEYGVFETKDFRVVRCICEDAEGFSPRAAFEWRVTEGSRRESHRHPLATGVYLVVGCDGDWGYYRYDNAPVISLVSA